MKSTKLMVFMAGVCLAAGSAAAGEIVTRGGGQVWVPQSCERPSAPAVDRTDAQALNESINRFNRYVASVDAYNRCLSDEAARDSEVLVGIINGSVRDLQQEAIAGVEVERAGLVRADP